ncbi:MAG: DUF1559 domain-containing protein [Planctomycetaceae bacterium]|nr:DUF1559 domain-containing protein [Planctomycetaceae bacterium]
MDELQVRRNLRHAAAASSSAHARCGISRAGFTILELLAVTAIISALAAVLLPALGSAREAARAVQCSHQLKQIGIALHNYHDAFQCFPAGTQREATLQSAYGWAVPLLPFLELPATHVLVDRNVRVADAVNSSARERRVPLFSCPSDLADDQFPLYAERAVLPPGAGDLLLVVLPSANYVGVYGNSEADEGFPPPAGEGAFIDSRPTRCNQFLRGLSNTVVVGERTAARVPSTWLGVEQRGEDALCRLLGSADVGPNCRVCDECEFSSRHHGGVNFLYGDGHVECVPDAIDAEVYRQMARLDSGDEKP